jgi:hypothetical protein
MWVVSELILSEAILRNIRISVIYGLYLLLTPTIASYTQVIPDSLKINDGPYVFIKGDQLLAKLIVNGEIITVPSEATTDKTTYIPDASQFENISKLAVLSDIHGQYELCLRLFKANHIIDENNQWAFGEGHLVIVGDIFDRGAQTTEALWFVYTLEQQARAAGGKVHYLLGNHEYMVLQNDLRYIHDKYTKSAQILDTPYDELYGVNTIMGRWLRSKSTVIKINDIIFLHGGISKVFMGDQLNLEETNRLYRESIDMEKKDIKASNKYSKFYGRNSPIWYRGYFNDDLSEANIDSLLVGMDAKHIIVGHTSQEMITELYDGRIYAVDSSLKNGVYGEILIIENGVYKRYTLAGELLEFK